MKRLNHVHPGEILLQDFLIPLGLSQNALARAAKVPPRRVNEIVLGKRSITADTAIRLAVALGTTASFWLALQSQYDLENAKVVIGANVAEDQPEYALDDVQESPWELFLEGLQLFNESGAELVREQPDHQEREDIL